MKKAGGMLWWSSGGWVRAGGLVGVGWGGVWGFERDYFSSNVYHAVISGPCRPARGRGRKVGVFQ